MFANVRDDSNSLRPLDLSKKEPGASQASDLKDICEVCGDNLSGTLRAKSGVKTCEGCKVFFKRTVAKDLTYHCQGGEGCEVSKSTRNRCQACRFSKCISVGMKSLGKWICKHLLQGFMVALFQCQAKGGRKQQ